MSAITEPAQDALEQLARTAHPLCFVCGRAGECGLGLRFALRDGGRVEACFKCAARLQGYEGVLHGGVTSSLLDGAMTNCLFAHGIAAVTAEITVRFRHPARTHVPATVTARIVRASPPLFVVEAELVQVGQVRAKATGKFMQRNERE